MSRSCPKSRRNFDVFWAAKFLGGGTPQISDSILKITVSTEQVAKFGDDRPRDLRDQAAKKRKKDSNIPQ